MRRNRRALRAMEFSLRGFGNPGFGLGPPIAEPVVSRNWRIVDASGSSMRGIVRTDAIRASLNVQTIQRSNEAGPRESIHQMNQKNENLASSEAPLSVPFANCYWVTPGRFLAGEYPADADDEATKARLLALLRTGVRTFIDL